MTYLNQPPSEEVQVEVAIALGCIVLSNTRNQELLQEEPGFNFDVLLDLLKSKSEVSYPEHLCKPLTSDSLILIFTLKMVDLV